MTTGKTLVHRGMVYVIEGDIFHLSQTALKYLGVILLTFPRIGEFGGEEQRGDGQDRVEVDANFNLRYISVETIPQIYVVQDESYPSSVERQPSDRLRPTPVTRTNAAASDARPRPRGAHSLTCLQ